jgi:hypothetical protein
MENTLYIPNRDVDNTNKKLLSEKPVKEALAKSESENKRIDASELFSHFTANIIKENKEFTR